MSKRWSKLQERVYNIVDPELNFQIHCALYEMNSNDGWHGEKLPRYWITIGKEIVFDYPRMFNTFERYGFNSYPWYNDISCISDLIEGYIERPKEKLMEPFENDSFGITNILRVCDRRIGKRRLKKIYDNVDNDVIKRIIELRYR